MADHLVLFVDRLIRPAVVQPGSNVSTQNTNSPSGETPAAPSSTQITDAHGESDVEAPLIQMAECRICQEEDNLRNLETPCACNGSLKYAHRKCVQHWCNEKRDTTCEICHQPYQHGYTCPSPPPPPADAAIDIGGGWRITGAPLSWQDPRILAVAEGGERHFLEAEYDEYEEDVDGSGAMFCRSAVLILMALLLLRHALSVTDSDEDDDTSTFFSLFLLRAASFLLPCYVMAWAISILQRRRQRQEAAAASSSSAMAAAASQLAFVLQQPSGQRRGLHLSIAPLPPPRQEEEPV